MKNKNIIESYIDKIKAVGLSTNKVINLDFDLMDPLVLVGLFVW